MPGTGQGHPLLSQGSILPQPLERPVFEEAIKRFHQQRNFVGDYASLVIDGRPVDLWALHKVVLEMGGFSKVEANGMWDIVGGKLGFVNFPRSDGQPPRSGHGTSLQITQSYKDYVQAFDAAYVRSTLENRQKTSSGGLVLSEQQSEQRDSSATRRLAKWYDEPRITETARPLRPSYAKVESMQSALQRMAQDQVNFKGMGRNGNVGLVEWVDDLCSHRLPQGVFQGKFQVLRRSWLKGDAEHGSEIHGTTNRRTASTPSASPGPASRSVWPYLESCKASGSSPSVRLAEAEEGTLSFAVICPPEQGAEYNSLLENVTTKCSEFETSELAVMYSMTRNEEHARKIITLVPATEDHGLLGQFSHHHQPRQFASSGKRPQAEDLIRVKNAFGAKLQARRAIANADDYPTVYGATTEHECDITPSNRVPDPLALLCRIHQ
ncbi:hypothetical protein NMY22_g20244 [Coprinellus aureogranulatus]|nr:hypothetical protein NMY22_g20244 [Coprinellus aureogranulatus]